MDDSVQLRERTFALNKTAAVSKAKQEGVLIDAENSAQIAGHAYWNQGNPEHYTRESRLRRLALKQHYRVRKAIEKWWKTFYTLRTDDGTASVTLADYMLMSGAIYLSLVGENIDSATLEENWVADSKGASHLDESRFFEAVFELADVWVDSIDGDEYADFLERVLWDTSHVAALASEKLPSTEDGAKVGDIADAIAQRLAALGLGGEIASPDDDNEEGEQREEERDDGSEQQQHIVQKAETVAPSPSPPPPPPGVSQEEADGIASFLAKLGGAVDGDSSSKSSSSMERSGLGGSVRQKKVEAAERASRPTLVRMNSGKLKLPDGDSSVLKLGPGGHVMKEPPASVTEEEMAGIGAFLSKMGVADADEGSSSLAPVGEEEDAPTLAAPTDEVEQDVAQAGVGDQPQRTVPAVPFAHFTTHERARAIGNVDDSEERAQLLGAMSPEDRGSVLALMPTSARDAVLLKEPTLAMDEITRKALDDQLIANAKASELASLPVESAAWKLSAMPPADAGKLLSTLPPGMQAPVVAVMEILKREAVLGTMRPADNASVAAGVAAINGKAKLASQAASDQAMALQALPASDAAALLGSLPNVEARSAVLAELHASDRASILSAASPIDRAAGMAALARLPTSKRKESDDALREAAQANSKALLLASTPDAALNAIRDLPAAEAAAVLLNLPEGVRGLVAASLMPEERDAILGEMRVPDLRAVAEAVRAVEALDDLLYPASGDEKRESDGTTIGDLSSREIAAAVTAAAIDPTTQASLLAKLPASERGDVLALVPAPLRATALEYLVDNLPETQKALEEQLVANAKAAELSTAPVQESVTMLAALSPTDAGKVLMTLPAPVKARIASGIDIAKRQAVLDSMRPADSSSVAAGVAALSSAAKIAALHTPRDQARALKALPQPEAVAVLGVLPNTEARAAVLAELPASDRVSIILSATSIEDRAAGVGAVASLPPDLREETEEALSAFDRSSLLTPSASAKRSSADEPPTIDDVSDKLDALTDESFIDALVEQGGEEHLKQHVADMLQDLTDSGMASGVQLWRVEPGSSLGALGAGGPSSTTHADPAADDGYTEEPVDSDDEDDGTGSPAPESSGDPADTSDTAEDALEGLEAEVWASAVCQNNSTPAALAMGKDPLLSKLRLAVAEAARSRSPGGLTEASEEILVSPLTWSRRKKSKKGDVARGAAVFVSPKMDDSQRSDVSEALGRLMGALHKVENKEAHNVLAQLKRGNPKGRQALQRLLMGLGCAPPPNRGAVRHHAVSYAGKSSGYGRLGPAPRAGHGAVRHHAVSYAGKSSGYGRLGPAPRAGRPRVRGRLWKPPPPPRTFERGRNVKSYPYQFGARRNNMVHAYRIAQRHVQHQLHQSKLRRFLAELRAYKRPPPLIVKITSALFLLLGDDAVTRHLKGGTGDIPADTTNLWSDMVRGIVLMPTKPEYLVHRMELAKSHPADTAQRKGATDLLSDVSYSDARGGSKAAAAIWKWCLLVIAEQEKLAAAVI
ncbi:hypothetical protein NFJ02_16g25600 [Pycnococcus provasolii]